MSEHLAPWRARRRRLLLAAWLGASACVVYEEAGTELDLQVVPHAGAICDDDGACADEIALSLTSVELLPCEPIARAAGPRALREALASVFTVSAAHAAHIEGTPTRWADGAVVVHGAGASPRTLGLLQPPPDRYCSVHVIVADIEPEVAEAEGRAELAGLVLSASGSAASTPWSTTTTASTEQTIALDAPLELEAGTAATLTVGFNIEAPSDAVTWATEDGARAWLLAAKNGMLVTAVVGRSE
jgi:hypothetical protein